MINTFNYKTLILIGPDLREADNPTKFYLIPRIFFHITLFAKPHSLTSSETPPEATRISLATSGKLQKLALLPNFADFKLLHQREHHLMKIDVARR